MELSQDNANHPHRIKSYESGKLTTSTNVYEQSIILSPENLIYPWELNKIENLSTSHIDQLLELDCDILLFGVGDKLVMPQQALLNPIYQKRIGLEIMTTHAACRTFNILLAEQRRVVAALIL